MNSVLENSNINLELYRAGSKIIYSIIVYVSYTGLLLCMLMQIQMLKPVLLEFTGLNLNLLSRKALIVFAFLVAAYFSITSSTHGLKKERDRAVVWANRLAVDRNLALEIQLRTVEESIANDELLSALSALDNTSAILQNRISEYYLSRIRQDNLIEVRVFKDNDKKGN